MRITGRKGQRGPGLRDLSAAVAIMILHAGPGQTAQPSAMSAAAPGGAGPQDLVPPLATASPRLRFHLGKVGKTGAAISPVLPDMPFPVSPYYVVQWNQNTYVQPTLLTVHDRTTYDDRLGLASYAFEAPDGHAHVWIYPYAGRSWAYELYESGGYVRPGGGSNLFLSSDKFIQASFNRTITFDFDGKLSRAAIYGSNQAEKSGAVLSQVFSGFGLLFKDPNTNKRKFVFLQIPIADSRPLSRSARFFCRNGAVWLYSPNLIHGELLLPYQPDAGPFHHFHYVLNSYLTDLLVDRTCATSGWSAAERDARNWSVTGFYIGLETQTVDMRHDITTAVPQGSLETGLQISDIRVVMH